MATYWDLTTLYTSLDDPQMDLDLKSIEKQVQELGEWQDKALTENDTLSPSAKIHHMLSTYTDLQYKIRMFKGYAALSSATDTTDQKALQRLDQIDAFNAPLIIIYVKMQQFIKQLDSIEQVMAEDDFLMEHRFFIEELLKESHHTLESEMESMIAKYKTTGSNAWSKLQGQLFSTLMVDFPKINEEGPKSLPITTVRNMAFSSNPEERKLAYEQELKAYEKIALSSSACLNGLKGEVITTSELKGYASPLEMTLEHSRMNQDILNALLDAMKEFLPTIRNFLKKKAEILGHKEGMPWYDMNAPLSQHSSTISYEEAKKLVVENFNSYNPNLGAFAQQAFDKNWIDVEPKAGKRGGAFCYGLPTGESRILLNFDGSLSNVITLAHELGHGYHSHCLGNEHLLNRTYTMPIAETASTFCETIIIKSAMKSWDDANRFMILNSQVDRYVAIIMDIYSRFLFEDALFKARQKGTLSSDEICQLMADAQKEAYGDAVNHNFNHPYMWANKVHYYMPERNYYNFPYAFGLLLAKGLYGMYEQEGKAFLPKYDQFLKMTGKNSIYDLGQSVGIDFTDINFFRKGTSVMKEDIEMLFNLLEK